VSKLVVQEFLTLDGVMQAPGPNDDDREGGFAYGGWLAPYFDDPLWHTIGQLHAQAGGLLLGRKTYQTMAGYWPHVTDADNPLASTMNRLAKYVASRTLREPVWSNTTLLGSDLVEEVARLQRRPGAELQVLGSGALVQTLMRHDLVDAYRPWVFPLLLGTGKHLFAEGTVPIGLRLVETSTSAMGVVLHTYERASRLDTRSLAPQPPPASAQT
jgi:dihydrofolate reductase